MDGNNPAPAGEFDFIVMGSGGGALTAAITAADLGLRVLVVEKADVVGGTTALSGGAIWVPCNPVAAAAGIVDTPEQAREYLGHVMSNHFRPDLVDAYLKHGPAMVAMVQERTEHRFAVETFVTDYKPELPGAVDFGRSLGSVPYDARRLGEHAAKVRRPLPSAMLLGGMSIDFGDVKYLMSVTKSWTSFRKVAGLILDYARDKLTHGRDMRMTLGNALIGGLFKAALDKGVSFRTGTPVVGLHRNDNRVAGVIVEVGGQRETILASRGVLLASGGFANNEELKSRHFKPGLEHPTMSVAECTGDAMRIGLEAGGRTGAQLHQNFLGFPLSVYTRADGSSETIMHSEGQRSMPGSICINEAGERFLNEALPYNDFAYAFERSGCERAYFVIDERALRNYGFGPVRPGPRWLRPLDEFLNAGYLISAPTIAELAFKLEVDPARMRATVERYNRFAAGGTDPDFSKGVSQHDRNNGDPTHQPHPNIGPLDQAPYYAIRIHPGNLGTYVGMEVDAHARVLGEDGLPVQGLHACGLDAHSIFAGCYPGGGSSIGPSMVFGYIAALSAAGRLTDAPGTDARAA